MKGNTKTIENAKKEQKGILRAGYGNKEEQGKLRAFMDQNIFLIQLHLLKKLLSKLTQI